MDTRRASLAAILGVAVGMVAAATEANACSCAGDAGTCSAYRNFDTIFIGRVVSVPQPRLRIRRDGAIEVGEGIGPARVAVVSCSKA